LDPKGRVLVDENGPVIISKTPSEHRWREMTMHRLIANGVFKVDPRKEGQKAKEAKGDGRGAQLNKEETRQLQREATDRIQKKRAERTKKIREKLEPLVMRVGGWSRGNKAGASSMGVVPAELGIAAHHWGNERGRVDTPKSVNSCQVSVYSNLKKGGTLSDASADFWEAFVNEWDAAPDPRRWYFDQVRVAKGLVIESSLEPAAIPEGPVAEQVSSVAAMLAEQKATRVAATIPEGVGHLALKAVFLMARGGDADMHEILETGERILALEITSNGA
jgi:hypothetical protein